jgi:O-acetyl-ADP-ribose deacetylase (regulator of RNase III)
MREALKARPFDRQRPIEFANRPFMPKIVLWQGDLLEQKGIDAIINAPNPLMRGGWGVDGAIHGAAGEGLLEECIKRNLRCPTGSAVVTEAHNLEKKNKIKKIIHAVGPVYPDTHDPMTGRAYPDYEQRCADARKLLAQTYESIYAIAQENKCRKIAIPAISTGIFGFPKDQAAQIVRDTLLSYFNAKHRSDIKEIRFILYSPADYELYEKVFAELENIESK